MHLPRALIPPESVRDADPATAGDGLSIRAAGELLGVPSPTLRSWERRYGLPTTTRSAGGHRRYRSPELTQLSLMRDQVAIGRRAADAARWVRGILDEANPRLDRVHSMLDASRAMDPVAIRAVLDMSCEDIGLGATLDQVLLPAMRQIGAWWEAGDCAVGQEHLTTEVVRGWLAKIVTLAPTPDPGNQVVLLGTGPKDSHTLGLEALAAQFARLRTATRMLGAGTSPSVFVAAVAAAPQATAVLVSHLPTHRRSAVSSLVALADTGAPLFFAGNAFLLPASRRGVPGTYLGESIATAALAIGHVDAHEGHPVTK